MITFCSEHCMPTDSFIPTATVSYKHMHTSRSHWCLIRTSRHTFMSSMPVRSWNWSTFSVCSLVNPSASIFPAVEGLRFPVVVVFYAVCACVWVPIGCGRLCGVVVGWRWPLSRGSTVAAGGRG